MHASAVGVYLRIKTIDCCISCSHSDINLQSQTAFFWVVFFPFFLFSFFQWEQVSCHWRFINLITNGTASQVLGVAADSLKGSFVSQLPAL